MLVGLFVLLACALGAPRTAHADDPAPAPPPSTRPSPYRFHFMLDAPIVLLGGAMSLTALAKPEPPPCLSDLRELVPGGSPGLPSCEPPSNMLGIDARVLGNHSPMAHSAANVLVFGLILAPHVFNAIGKSRFDTAWLEDVTITLESVLVAQGLTQVTKAATDRHAPIVYDDTVPLDERTSTDALRSFWSGHTATAFSAATSFAVSYWLRHPNDPWRWVVLATLESAALCTGLLKIRAGYHYPTDVAAGAAAGIGAGILVPALHMRW